MYAKERRDNTREQSETRRERRESMKLDKTWNKETREKRYNEEG